MYGKFVAEADDVCERWGTKFHRGDKTHYFFTYGARQCFLPGGIMILF
jgi:hypothetical protein